MDEKGDPKSMGIELESRRGTKPLMQSFNVEWKARSDAKIPESVFKGVLSYQCTSASLLKILRGKLSS